MRSLKSKNVWYEFICILLPTPYIKWDVVYFVINTGWLLTWPGKCTKDEEAGNSNIALVFDIQNVIGSTPRDQLLVYSISNINSQLGFQAIWLLSKVPLNPPVQEECIGTLPQTVCSQDDLKCVNLKWYTLTKVHFKIMNACRCKTDVIHTLIVSHTEHTISRTTYM